MQTFNLVIEVHRSVLAEHQDDAGEQAERLRESIEGLLGDASVYVEKVEAEG